MDEGLLANILARSESDGFRCVGPLAAGLLKKAAKFERSRSLTSEGVGRYRRHLPAAHSDVGGEETEGLYCCKRSSFRASPRVDDY